MGVLRVVVVGLMVTLAGRLWLLQVVDGDRYVRAAVNVSVRTVALAPLRGQILDAAGRPLVANKTVPVVSVDGVALAHQADGGRAVLGRLAAVLRQPYERLAGKIRTCGPGVPRPCWPGSPYEQIPVADGVPVQVALQITERQADFPGVTTELRPIRVYPYGEAAGHTLGYLQAGVGRDGLEAVYDRDLAGRPGRRVVAVDNAGRVTRVVAQDPATTGNSLVTSLDARIQVIAERALATALTRTGGTSGAVVVLESNTGRVAALAGYPGYDPSVWTGGVTARQYAGLPLLSRAVQGQWAPGSTWKVASVAAAANAGYRLDGRYGCPSGYTVGDRLFRNFASADLGIMTMRQALVKSCDTVFYRIADELWRRRSDVPRRTATGFGFGTRTGIDLPGEAAGAVPQASPRPGDAANFAIGQGGVLVTPLQLARAYAALANGGTLYAPRVGERVVRPDGTTVRSIVPPVTGRLPASAATLAYIRGALAGVPRSGTAAAAFKGFPFGRIAVAGKTGTAESAGHRDTSWFASFAPDPAYTVVVVLSEGGRGARGAAPAARQIWEGIDGLRETR
ncbi:peptidoglycan D,D-transpeptidase FtsI family protein [Nonomuraea sediminis]|uniref:peptidoglycan D,D-transpeptidase FtsI family protein n=1 Tax=Nonomuraea sediminis TaxID=2835864 RepID=UPI001BDC6693|nr:penicillin-binding transpeptidase domain-containing protein [Nonomuraea sediminis]